MNPKIYILASGVAGLLLGVGVGYILTKKKFQSLADAEIESVRVAFQKEYNETVNIKPDPEQFARELAEARIVADKIVQAHYAENATPEGVEKHHIYTEMVKDYDTGVVDNSLVRNNQLMVPGHISADEWGLDMGYTKQTLEWHPEEETLMDEMTGDVIDDPSEYIDVRVLQLFDTGDDPDLVFFRNLDLSVDYQIVRIKAEG